MFFDTHCHIDFAELGEPQKTIQQAMDANVHRFLLPATTQERWADVTSLASHFPSVYGALGLHPYFLPSEMDITSSISRLDHALNQRSNKIVAVGECGLDAIVDINFKQQVDVFNEHIRLAQYYQLPLVIHSRKTHHHILSLLKQARFAEGGVLHGFTGSEQQARQLIDSGLKIGVGGSITYPRAQKTRRAIAALPLESLVLETDAPDMPLHGFQGENNHPRRLPLIFQCLLELRPEGEDELKCQLWQNSCEVFQLLAAC
ncbi:MAG: TatD family hydrolase [Vibrio sp.]